MRGLTGQERYWLAAGVSGQGEEFSCSTVEAVHATLTEHGRMRKTEETYQCDDDPDFEDVYDEWEPTELGALALRVCPPEDA